MYLLDSSTILYPHNEQHDDAGYAHDGVPRLRVVYVAKDALPGLHEGGARGHNAQDVPHLRGDDDQGAGGGESRRHRTGHEIYQESYKKTVNYHILKGFR